MIVSKMSVPPTISLIIPTRNGADTLRELLAMLSVQTLSFLEVLVVDSSSTDGSVKIAEDSGARVTVISEKEFDHGGTRSLLAREAKGDLLVFLTQDAIPASKDALETLIAPLITSKEIAVTYGRQKPSFDANEFASHLRHVNYPKRSSIRGLNDRSTYGFRTIFVSNSFAAYRKAKLEEVGFFKNGLIFGEDTCTVGKLLFQGYKIAYVSEAVVYHSHNYTCGEELRRSFDIGVLHSTEKWLIDTYGRAEGEGLKYIISEFSYLMRQKKVHLLPTFFVRIGLKFIGYKLGRNFKLIPEGIIPLLSMHRLWWDRKNFLSQEPDAKKSG